MSGESLESSQSADPSTVPARGDGAPPAAQPRDPSTGHYVKRQPMSAERKARYIEGLRKSASHRFAAQYATPNGTPAADPRDIGYSYSSFLRERKLDPTFDEACSEALNFALGTLEESLLARAFRPDVREQWDAKTGTLTGRSEAWESANRCARAILARHTPEWVDQQRRQVDSTVTVHHNGGAPGGVGFLLTPTLINMLSDDEKHQLSGLLRSMTERQHQLEQSQPKQLPEGGTL